MEAGTVQQIQGLSRMTVGELREKYLEVFGEETRSYHKAFLRKRIAWRLQALAEGGLSERARRRAGELANDADLRLRAPRDRRLPLPGTLLVRAFQGRDLVVQVLDDGFAFEGRRYRSLSAIARQVTDPVSLPVPPWRTRFPRTRGDRPNNGRC